MTGVELGILLVVVFLLMILFVVFAASVAHKLSSEPKDPDDTTKRNGFGSNFTGSAGS